MARSSRPVRLVLPGLLLVAVPWSAAVEAGSGALAGACGEFRGDCNGDGRVSIGELQRVLAMSLGSQAPACNVDADGDAAVSGAELQAVVDAFLGMRVPPSVRVFPAGATVAAGASEPFGAAVLGCGEETSVSWSVEEAGGGAVTDAGVYTAPATPGTFHVVATSQADPAVLARATVAVVTETLLVEQTVSPSSSDQTIEVTGKLTATIAGGLLDEPVAVRIVETGGVPAPAGYTPLTPWYLVTADGGPPPFPMELALAGPAAGGSVVGARAVGAETVVIEYVPPAVYEVASTSVAASAARGAAAPPSTVIRNQGTPVCLAAGPTGASMNRYETTNFNIIYYTDNLYAVPSDSDYRAEYHSNPLLPDFVEDVAVFLERAHSYYVDTLHLRPPVRPSGETRIFVQIRNYKESQWLPLSKAIHIANNFDSASLLGSNWRGDDSTLLSHELAHELFHALENAYYAFTSMYAVQWLTESLADFAAHAVTPRSQALLDIKLVNFGDWLRLVFWDPRNEEMRYLGASYLDFVAERGGFSLSPSFMENEYTATVGQQEAVDFLLTEHAFMKLLYGDFVRYFYFNEGSALAKTYYPYIKKNPRSLRFRNELASVANRWRYEEEKVGEKTFALGGYPGGVMSLTADYLAVFPSSKSVVPKDDTVRLFTVEMKTDLQDGELAILYRGKNGRPVDAGEEMPAKGTVRSLKLGAKEAADSFWVLVVNPNESSVPPVRHEVLVRQLWIDSVTPGAGVVGSQVTIRGRGFGAVQGASELRFSGVPAAIAKPEDWSATEIKVTVPDDAPGSSKITVRVEGVDSNEVPFQVILNVQMTFQVDRLDMCADPRPNQVTTWTAAVTSPYKAPLTYVWAASWASAPPGGNEATFVADTTGCPRSADCVLSACSLSGLTVSVTVTDSLGRVGSRWDNWGGAY